MSIAQIIENGVVVNCIAINPAAVVSTDGLKATWSGGEYDAPEGATLMMQSGAQIGWALSGGVLSAPAVAIPPPGVPAMVTRRQFFQAAAQEGIITPAGALALFATGTIPPSLAQAISELPTAQQFAAQIAILGDANFERGNPLIAALATAMGETSAQIDALFTLAATL